LAFGTASQLNIACSQSQLAASLLLLVDSLYPAECMRACPAPEGENCKCDAEAMTSRKKRWTSHGNIFHAIRKRFAATAAFVPGRIWWRVDGYMHTFFFLRHARHHAESSVLSMTVGCLAALAC
jgi:hypothetical protein